PLPKLAGWPSSLRPPFRLYVWPVPPVRPLGIRAEARLTEAISPHYEMRAHGEVKRGSLDAGTWLPGDDGSMWPLCLGRKRDNGLLLQVLRESHCAALSSVRHRPGSLVHPGEMIRIEEYPPGPSTNTRAFQCFESSTSSCGWPLLLRVRPGENAPGVGVDSHKGKPKKSEGDQKKKQEMDYMSGQGERTDRYGAGLH
ncbi:unnamed protein product, partial [Pleuronectes platessa]